MATRNYTSAVRARHAEDTRKSVLDAALRLFTENGYSVTNMAAIAETAGVALNTVYTSVGGKPALILALAQESADDELIESTMARMLDVSPDPGLILAVIADGTGEVTRRQLPVISLMLDNRTADPAVAAAADLADKLYRDRLRRVAGHLVEIGILRPGLGRAKVEQILWYYFGVESWRTLRRMGWSWKNAADWLAEQAGRALLAEPPERARG